VPVFNPGTITLRLYHAISANDPNPVLIASYEKGSDFVSGDIINYTALAVNYSTGFFLWTRYSSQSNEETLIGLEKITDTPSGNSSIVSFENSTKYGAAVKVDITTAVSGVGFLPGLFELDVTNFQNLSGNNSGTFFLYASPFPYNPSQVVRFGNYTKGDFGFETNIKDFGSDFGNYETKGVLFCTYQDNDTGQVYSVNLSIVSQAPPGAATLADIAYQQFAGKGIIHKGNGQRLRVAASFIAPPPPPEIFSVSPSTALVGATVTVTGINFDSSFYVGFFDGWYVKATVISSTQATAVVPPQVTTGLLTASGDLGAVESTVLFTVGTAPPPPTLSSFSPTSGLVGASVSLVGTNFLAGMTCSFNGGAPQACTVASATSATVNAPTGATTGKLTITTTAGSAQSATDFTVSTPGTSIIFLDTFTDADGVALSAHTPDIGVTWLGTFGLDAYIKDNRAAAVGSSGFYVVSSPTTADCVITCDLKVSANLNGFAFRFSGPGSFLYAYITTSGIRLETFAGAPSNLATVNGSLGGVVPVIIALDGSSITVQAGGLTASATSSYNQTVAQHALLINDVYPNAYWENFKISKL
jgi:hypothetical protein